MAVQAAHTEDGEEQQEVVQATWKGKEVSGWLPPPLFTIARIDGRFWSPRLLGERKV